MSTKASTAALDNNARGFSSASNADRATRLAVSESLESVVAQGSSEVLKAPEFDHRRKP